MSQTTEMLEKIYQAIIMLRGDIDLLKARLIPEATPTDQEIKAIKELEEDIEAVSVVSASVIENVPL